MWVFAQRRGRFYAVIYKGLDPVTGKEWRRWHPAGTDRAAAERLAALLAAEEQGRADAVRSLTFGAYLTGQRLRAEQPTVVISECTAPRCPGADRCQVRQGGDDRATQPAESGSRRMTAEDPIPQFLDAISPSCTMFA